MQLWVNTIYWGLLPLGRKARAGYPTIGPTSPVKGRPAASPPTGQPSPVKARGQPAAVRTKASNCRCLSKDAWSEGEG
jgi:hypothetical protein